MARMPRLSVRAIIALVLVDLALVSAISVAIGLWTTRAQRHDALVVNVAGRQRMLSQRLAKEAALGKARGTVQVSLERMHTSAHELAANLRALLDGGTVPYGATTAQVPPARDPAFRAALERVWEEWFPLHTAAHLVLATDPATPEFAAALAELDRASGAILQRIDDAVELYAATAEARVRRLEFTQIAFLLLGLLVAAAGYALASLEVLRPLAALDRTARQLADGRPGGPIRPPAARELASLAAALERLRTRPPAPAPRTDPATTRDPTQPPAKYPLSLR